MATRVRLPYGSLPFGHIVHLLIITMQSAIDNIKATYDYETCKEIVNHGCQSGVCHEHIYYGDTFKFLDTYEDEIIDCVSDVLGIEVLSETLYHNDGDLDMYKNDLTWTFIELVAMRIVDEFENTTQEEESDSSYNPPRSMTEARYAFA